MDQVGHTRYNQGMKTAVSIPDEIYEEAEAFAKRHDMARSQLYAEALAEYLAQHDPETLTARINAAVDACPLTSDDKTWLDRSAKQLAEKVAWKPASGAARRPRKASRR
jgi:hypothetical protein